MLSTHTSSRLPELERSTYFLLLLHTVIISLIITLVVDLGLQHQSLKKSSLEEHKNMMLAIYVNIFKYGMGLMAEYKLKTTCGSRCLFFIQIFTPLFGIIAVVLSLIILYPVWGYFALIIWALLTLDAMIKLLAEILQCLIPRFAHARETLTSHFNNRAENLSAGIQENRFASLEGVLTYPSERRMM